MKTDQEEKYSNGGAATKGSGACPLTEGVVCQMALALI